MENQAQRKNEAGEESVQAMREGKAQTMRGEKTQAMGQKAAGDFRE